MRDPFHSSHRDAEHVDVAHHALLQPAPSGLIRVDSRRWFLQPTWRETCHRQLDAEEKPRASGRFANCDNPCALGKHYENIDDMALPLGL